ncbi:only prolin and serin are matching in the corresponding protein [Neofusicoccum parvum]|nr:only prolin and serin are matching in the corresponding protein [Neofusicoccum parvum]
MRDLKPLMLPKLATVRNPLADSPTAEERASAAYPDSSFSASECSTPLSQTFSANDHVRHSSSLSSLSSSPPSSYEHLDSMTSSSKLPRLPEDPMEGPFASDLDEDEEFEGKLGSWCLCSVAEGCPHGDSRTSYSTPSLASPAYDCPDSPFGDDGESSLWTVQGDHPRINSIRRPFQPGFLNFRIRPASVGEHQPDRAPPKPFQVIC